MRTCLAVVAASRQLRRRKQQLERSAGSKAESACMAGGAGTAALLQRPRRERSGPSTAVLGRRKGSRSHRGAAAFMPGQDNAQRRERSRVFGAAFASAEKGACCVELTGGQLRCLRCGGSHHKATTPLAKVVEPASGAAPSHPKSWKLPHEHWRRDVSSREVRQGRLQLWSARADAELAAGV